MSYLCESLMTPVHETCMTSAPISRALQMMRRRDTDFVAVIGPTHRVAAVLTDRDIAVRALAAGLPADAPIRDIMYRLQLVSVLPEDTLSTAELRMNDAGVDHVLVLARHGMLLGSITRSRIEEDRRPGPGGVMQPETHIEWHERIGAAS